MQEELREMFEKMRPSERQREDLWEQINHKQQRGRKKRSRFLSAAVIGFLVLAAGIWIYAASPENIIQAMKALLGIEQKQEMEEMVIKEEAKAAVNEEIIKNVKNARKHDKMYAPRLVMCTDRLLLFANTAGMIVYDRKENKAIMTVDLQKMGCSYVEKGGYIVTGFLPKEDQLYIFNETGGKLEEVYYILDLSDVGIIEKKSFYEYEKNQRNKIKKRLYDEWKNFEKKHYQDAFNALQGEPVLKTGNVYNEFAFCWKNHDGRKISSLWIDKKDRYFMFTKDVKSGRSEKERLFLRVQDETEEMLPKFAYHGQNEILGAICDYFCEDAQKKQEKEKELGIYDGEIYIPAPIIFRKIQKKKNVIVFLELAFGYYYKNGIILERTGGGMTGMRIKLRKTEQGYKVTECLSAADGSGNRKSIEDFTRGYPEITEKYFDYDMLMEKQAKMERKMYRIYLKTSKPGVIYYRDAGGLKEIEE